MHPPSKSKRSLAAKILFAFTGALVAALLFADLAIACTAFIAGKKTTADGSILFAKTEDDRPGYVDYLWYIPGKKHPDESTIKLVGGNEIPQVPETWGFFWDQPPGTEYSNAVINEWGLALGSDACPSREDPIEEVEKRGDLLQGGIGWRLRIILAERCKTAREAVELAAQLLDKYGYRASGRTLNIVDQKEAWILQMVRGKQYVARRVKDDEVVALANTYTIREVDMRDRDNFVCSKNLITYAQKRGWYDPEQDGKFDFAKAYADPRSRTDKRNTRRHWLMAKMANRHFPLSWQEADEGKMPVSFKPDRKLTLREVMAIMRSHFEGTELDESNDYERSPHRNSSRPICTYATHRTTIIQQRSWLPREMGTVIWRALYEPCSSGFVPWYLCATDIPEEFRNAPRSLYRGDMDLHDYHFSLPGQPEELDLNSASCVFGLMAGLVDADYGNVIEYVRGRWRDFEDYQFNMQETVEKTAQELYRKDQEAARLYLADYTRSRAQKSLEIARSILAVLQHRAWNAAQGEKLIIK
ncbi:MAG: C69 family dipeptidase [Candidatus Krumholzibacteriota bacterium]|nr:C69 family dipeptidase [Candidatus Krumholzibacteriota bacterium]